MQRSESLDFGGEHIAHVVALRARTRQTSEPEDSSP
jgi:hypothetical protein